MNNFIVGKCCDLYKCEKIARERHCTVENVTYKELEVWTTIDGQTCQCQGGLSFCSKVPEEKGGCHHEQHVYKHMESWMVDSCTNCTCIDGESRCIAHMCEINESRIKKPDCLPLKCNKECPEGYRLNRKGCKICRCVSPKYEELLHMYNITKIDELRDILDEHFNAAHDKTTPITASTEVFVTETPVTDIFDDRQHITTTVFTSGKNFFSILRI